MIDAPNYTQFPNVLIELMPEMNGAELKVTLAIARKTFGWHKEKDKISLTQLQKLTGLSRQSVLDGLSAGIERGTIVRGDETPDGYEYSLNVVQKLDYPQDSDASGQEIRPEVVEKLDHTLVQKLDTQKKELKEKINKEDGAKEFADVRDEIKAIFTIPHDFDWSILDQTFRAVPDPALLIQIAHNVRATCGSIFNIRVFADTAQFQFMRQNAQRGQPHILRMP